MLPRSIPEMLHDSNFPEEWSHSLFTNHASHHITQPRQVGTPQSMARYSKSADYIVYKSLISMTLNFSA